MKMERTNVVLDEKVLAQAKKLTGILKLRGKVDWQGDLSEPQS